MTYELERTTSTKAKLTVKAAADEINQVKKTAVAKLGDNVKLSGFREGKAPAKMIEKSIDQNALQQEVLENLVNQLYPQAITKSGLRPVAQPEINVSKFVPFSELEFIAEVETVGEVKLGDYKAINLEKSKPSVTAKDVNEVLNNLNQQNAPRQDAKRAAKDGDEITIDFKGYDAGTNQAITGADGADYALTLGSKQFIPGFEENLVGMKAGEEKQFNLTFPKDYGVASLQGKKVKFDVTAKKVTEVKLAKLDDAWAAKVSPFKTLAELKKDIKAQLTTEKQRGVDQQYQQDLLNKISEKSSVEIPKALIDEEIERLENEEKQNLAYQGQTFEEHLKAEGVSAKQHKEQKRDAATKRVKSSLVLTEISEKENITVTDEEINNQLDLLRQRHTDQKMQLELSKPSARSEIGNQILTHKTFSKLTSYANTPAQANK